MQNSNLCFRIDSAQQVTTPTISLKNGHVTKMCIGYILRFIHFSLTVAIQNHKDKTIISIMPGNAVRTACVSIFQMGNDADISLLY